MIGSELEKTVDVYLANEGEAQVIVERYAFFYSLSQNVITIKAKIGMIQKVVGDIVQLDLDRLYQRFGDVETRRKVGIISKVAKNGTNVEIEITDLGNMFNRVCNITANSAPVFGSATQDEKMLNGYIVHSTLEVPDATSEKEWGTQLIG